MIGPTSDKITVSGGHLRHNGNSCGLRIEKNWIFIGCKMVSMEAFNHIADEVKEFRERKPVWYSFQYQLRANGAIHSCKLKAIDDQDAREKFYNETSGGAIVESIEFVREES